MRPGRSSRYGRYTGGPDPLAPPVDLSEALEEIADEVMAGYSPEQAMREYLRRGSRSTTGLDDLARRVAQRRQDILSRHHLDGTLQEIKQLLDEAVLEERKQLVRDVRMDKTDRSFREMQMESLPDSTAAAVSELSGYDWQSSTARQKYEQIKDLLGREMLDQRFAGMKSAMQNATVDDRAAISEMLSDLNDLLDKHARGEDTQADFDQFMARHGGQFPENPQNIDELIDTLAKRSAAAARMMASMSPEQREELMELSAQAFGSQQLMDQLNRLDANLQGLRPGEDWTDPSSSTATRAWVWVTAPERCRTWLTWTNWASSSPSRIRGPRSPISTSTSSPASSTRRPLLMRALWPIWRRRCAIPGCCAADPTATCGSPRLPCAD